MGIPPIYTYLIAAVVWCPDVFIVFGRNQSKRDRNDEVVASLMCKKKELEVDSGVSGDLKDAVQGGPKCKRFINLHHLDASWRVLSLSGFD